MFQQRTIITHSHPNSNYCWSRLKSPIRYLNVIRFSQTQRLCDSLWIYIYIHLRLQKTTTYGRSTVTWTILDISVNEMRKCGCLSVFVCLFVTLRVGRGVRSSGIYWANNHTKYLYISYCHCNLLLILIHCSVRWAFYDALSSTLFSASRSQAN